MATPEEKRSRRRAIAVTHLRDAIVANHAIANRAGERLAERIQAWMRDTNSKKARRMQDDLALLEVARSLVLHESEMRAPSARTALGLLGSDELSRLGLPPGPLPQWMVAIFDTVGTLNYGLVFRTEKYFFDWLRHASTYGIDLESESPVGAFASIRIARMREAGEVFNEEEIRSEYEPARFESALAQPCYALSIVLSEMIKSGVDPAVDFPSWWDAAVAVVVALDPLIDPRPLGLGLLPTWNNEGDENTFNAREAIPIYIPDPVRWSEEGDDRLWELVARADAVLSARGNLALSRPLPSDPRPTGTSAAEPRGNEDRIRARLGERAERVISVLRLLLNYEADFIPATDLDGMGLSSKTVFSAAGDWGKDRRVGDDRRLYLAKAKLVKYVIDDWRPKASSSDASDQTV